MLCSNNIAEKDDRFWHGFQRIYNNNNNTLLNEYKLLHALSIVKIKQLEAVLITFLNNTGTYCLLFLNNTRAKLAML